MNKNQDIISLNKQAWNNVAKMYEKEYVTQINPLFDFFCDQLSKGSFILDLTIGLFKIVLICLLFFFSFSVNFIKRIEDLI